MKLDSNEPRIIPPTTSYSHNREDNDSDYDGIPLTWKENLTIASICALGAAVIIGFIYLIAR